MTTTAETLHHVVRRQTLELTLPEQRGAHDLQEEVRRIVHGRLLPVMDELFSRLGSANEVIELERVEIDLGDVASAALDDQLVERARQKLEEVLSKEIAALRDSPNGERPGARLLGSEQSRVELLRVFLASGAVPWWAPRGVSVDVEAVLRQLLATATAVVVGMLRDVALPTVATRIVKQFAPATRRSLMAALAPSNAANLEQAILDWERLLSGEQTAVGPVTGAYRRPIRLRPPAGLDMGRFVESAVLYRLMSRGNHDLTTEEVSRYLVERVAAQSRGSEALVLDRLVDRSHLVLPLASEVRRWLEQGLAKPGGAKPRRSRDREAARSYPPEPHSRGAASDSATRVAVPGRVRDPGTMPVENGETAKVARCEDREQSSERPAAARSDRRLWSERHFLSSPAGPGASTRGPASVGPPGGGEAGESRRPVPWRGGESVTAEEGQYIENAGLILLWPFLTRFFERTGLVEAKAFRSDAEHERGVLLLQHLATGETQWPEPVLSLNKVLCGWPQDEPVAKSIEVTETDAAEARELLASVIDNWGALKSTSVQGLRASFLQREGHLVRADEGWKLRVARAGYDVLLDQLPWGIGLVRLPWMAQPLFVQW